MAAEGYDVSEEQVESLLSLSLQHYNEYLADEPVGCRSNEDQPVPIYSTQTFEEAGLLTMNRGVLLTFENDAGKMTGQFQISIVRSF